MKNLLTLIIILGIAYTAQAQTQPQPQISLQHNGNSSFYTSATTAMTAAQNGDTLYFPGGSFGNISIDKQLVIYGTGIHPDSTTAVGVSVLSYIYFREGSSGTKLQGISSNNIYFSPTNQVNQTLENIIVSRCYIQSNNTNGAVQLYGSYLDTVRNVIFQENIIKGSSSSFYALVYVSNTHYENIFITKNIINYRVLRAKNTYFLNNIFLSETSSSSSYFTFATTKDCFFFNNYFNSPHLLTQLSNTSYLQNCIFNNNLFNGSVSFPYSSNFGTNNQSNQTEANTFINVTSTVFTFSQDYHLKSTSTGVNAGFYGTDIGIYGTTVPTKEGWTPNNPRILYSNVASISAPDWTLPVQIQTKAVDNQ